MDCADRDVSESAVPRPTAAELESRSAGLAGSPWSRGGAVACVGIASEIEPMTPKRVRYHDAGADVAPQVLTDALATIERVAAVGQDLTTARAAQLGDDTWPSRLLLIGAGNPATPSMVVQTTLQNTTAISDLPGPTGGIMLKSTTGATIIVNDTGIDIQNGKGASIAMAGPSVTINNGALVVI